MATRRSLVCLALGTAFFLSACWDRPVLRVPSPSGEAVAMVLERPSIDPPNQRLVLERHGEETELLRLAPDSEAGIEITWSGDGRRVGFLISRGRFVVFDARNASKVADVHLLAADEKASRVTPRRIRFSGDGRTVDYEVCSWTDAQSCSERRRRSL